MADLISGSGQIQMTVQITRKDTGKVEEYELVGAATLEEAQELARQLNLDLKEKTHGDDASGSDT